MKGGGNSIFLLILALRWWMGCTEEMEAGAAKERLNKRLEDAVCELDNSLAGIHGSGELNGANDSDESDEDMSEAESQPRKR